MKIGWIGSAEESVIVCQEFAVVFFKRTLCERHQRTMCDRNCEGGCVPRTVAHSNVMQSGSSLDNGVE